MTQSGNRGNRGQPPISGIRWLSPILFLLAAGFGFQDQPTRWPTGGPIEFVINVAGLPQTLEQDAYVGALRKALETWRNVQTVDLPFTIGPIISEAAKTSPIGDGVNMIFWKPGFVPRDQFAGKAYPFATDCDILLSPKPPFTLLDIQATVLHELGHCMGLAHSSAASVMTKFQGLPAIGYDDTIALAILYPTSAWPLARRSATIKGRLQHFGKPLAGAVLRIIDAQTSRVILAGFSGLVAQQRRKDLTGRFELPGLPQRPLKLSIEPLDDFMAADPSGYGAPVSTPPEPFKAILIELPELEPGDIHDLGTLNLTD